MPPNIIRLPDIMQPSGIIKGIINRRETFTAAVLDVFMERGIRFDGLVGVSAGA